MKVIIITGTPGTGKTTLAKKIAKQKNFLYIDGKAVIKSAKLDRKYDKKRNCFIIDERKFVKELIKIIENIKRSNEERRNSDNKKKNFLVKRKEEKYLQQIKKQQIKGIIIDSHLSQFLPKKYVDLCIVTKTELKTLQKRLLKRKYSKEKIRENLDAEIFDVCLEEAREQGHKIKIVFT